MKNEMRVLALALWGALHVVSANHCAEAQFTNGAVARVSTGPGDITPDGVAGGPESSSNGRYIVFHSTASNIVNDDTNFSRDVFLRDLQSDTTTRVSVSSAGVEGSSESRDPTISPVAPDGFFVVAYGSFSENLSDTPTDLNDVSDIYLSAPTLSNRTFLITQTPDGQLANGESELPSVTLIPNQNRALIVYESFADNLVSSDTNDSRDVFLTEATFQNIASGSPTLRLSTTRISVTATGVGETDGASNAPVISGNGRVVAFESSASNLITDGVSGGATQIYAYDIPTRTMRLISKNEQGDPGDDDSNGASISYNGRYVTYTSIATNLVAGATSGRRHVIRYDIERNISELVNVNEEGQVGNGDASDARITSNGRFVVFSDNSSNLVAGDSGDIADVFVRDMETGDLARASVSLSGGNPNGTSNNGDLVAAGFNSTSGTISFLSQATNLVLNDSSGADVFSADGTITPPPLNENTELEVPPDVSVTGRKARLTFQTFSTVDISPVRGISANIAAAEGDRVRYEYRLRGPGGQRIDNSRKLAKRSTVTVRRLRPGKYTARYRVVVKRDGEVVQRTPLCPPQRFRVPRPS